MHRKSEEAQMKLSFPYCEAERDVPVPGNLDGGRELAFHVADCYGS